MTKFYFFIALITIFVCLSIRLGIWQLERAEEKRLLLKQATTDVQLSASDWQDAENGTLLTLRGRYKHDTYFLLDNQSYQGSVGYSPIVPFMVEALTPTSEPVVFMVNLGWVKANIDRSVLPEIVLPSGEVKVKVRVYQPDKDVFRLSDKQYDNIDWPKRIQYFSGEYFAEQLAKKTGLKTVLVPYQVRIEQGEIGARIAHWASSSMTPEKHQAYAVQWFTLSVFLLLCSGFYFYQQRKGHKKEQGKD
ncbi:SURF1 family protein [Marinomonas agarivorans]|nr:SURF1 family protein [Marinomonas agarivorans]